MLYEFPEAMKQTLITRLAALNSAEAVSKLKKCQEKSDFHGWKRAVADEIHGALHWEACHGSRIAQMSPTLNGTELNA
jgi:hypothetical protein